MLIKAWNKKKKSAFQFKKYNSKKAQETGDLIGNEISNKITKVSKNSQQNNSKTVTNERIIKIPKERYISQEERQKIIDDLRLMR